MITLRNCWYRVPYAKSMFVFKPRRTSQVVDNLLDAWREGRQGFHGIIPPEIKHLQDLVVALGYGSRKHACILFFLAWLSRHGVKSDPVYAKAREIIPFFPSLWDPQAPCQDPDLYVLLRKGMIPFLNGDGRLEKWHENLVRLRNDFEGDPRKVLLASPLNRVEQLKMLQSFHGFGPKVSSLFLVLCQSTSWHLCDDSPITEELYYQLLGIKAVPVDVMLMKQFRQHDLVAKWPTDHHHGLQKGISTYFNAFCEHDGISTREVSQAWWHHSSIICANKPLNRKKMIEYCNEMCSITETCRYLVMPKELKKNGKLGWDRATPRKQV